MSSRTRNAAHILESIAEKSARVKQSADVLTQCISEFEHFLSKMPGRTEAWAYATHPDATPEEAASGYEMVLKFHREGKGWQISHGSYIEGRNGDGDVPVDYKPLMEAPLKYKIAAVKMFPDLLDGIDKSQDALFAQIESATSDHLQFMARLKAQSQEGK